MTKYLAAIVAAIGSAGGWAQALSVLWLVLTLVLLIYYIPRVTGALTDQSKAAQVAQGQSLNLGVNHGTVNVAGRDIVFQAAPSPEKEEPKEIDAMQTFVVSDKNTVAHPIEWLRELLPNKDRAISIPFLMDVVVTDLSTEQRHRQENVTPQDAIDLVRQWQIDKKIPFRLEIFPRMTPVRDASGEIAMYVAGAMTEGASAGLAPAPSIELGMAVAGPDSVNPPPGTVAAGITFGPPMTPAMAWASRPNILRSSASHLPIGIRLDLKPIGVELDSWRIAVPEEERGRVLFAYAGKADRKEMVADAGTSSALPGPVDLAVFGGRDAINDDDVIILGFLDLPSSLWVGDSRGLQPFLGLDGVVAWWKEANQGTAQKDVSR